MALPPLPYRLAAAAVIILIQAPAILGWMDWPRSLNSSRGFRPSGDGAGSRQRVSLSARDANDVDNNNNKIDEDDDKSDRPNSKRVPKGKGPKRGDEVKPLFAVNDHVHHISRLEAIFDMDTDFVIDELPSDGEKSQRLLEEGERVVLGDWMEWEEIPCTGDSCGDDFDVSDFDVVDKYFLYTNCTHINFPPPYFHISNVTSPRSSRWLPPKLM